MPRFSWNSLKHFWQIHVIVALCTAVATGVLAGALVVGDSVRGSLRHLTTERLGAIQHALLADHFFQPDLLNRESKVPTILINGTIVVPQTQARASKVNIAGVTDDFFTFWEAEAPNLNKPEGQPFNAIVINETLQNELNVQVGDTLLVNMSQATDIHPEFLLGERDAAKAIQSLRMVISDIIPTKNFGRFSLQANQSVPFNAFIWLPILQNALGQDEKVNVVFTADTDALSADDLALTLAALDLNIKADENHLDLQSDQYLLKPILSETALTVASENRIPTLPTLTYLANTITANDKTIPYSTIVALPTDAGEFAQLLDTHTTEADQQAYQQSQEQILLTDDDISELRRVEKEYSRLGKERPELGTTEISREQLAEFKEVSAALGLLITRSRQGGDIVLNRWAADDIGAKVGERIAITYYSVNTEEEYITETVVFRLKGILPIEGITADRDLIPEFPGIHDTADMSDWESPFPIDYTLVHAEDEAYWDEYRATPKAFIPLEIGKRLWQNRFGDLTSIRFGIAPDTDIQGTRTLFETEFLKRIQPEQVGFQFLSPQVEGLHASSGATDFGMLFGSLSGFIIIAVALLIALLFRVGVEQRSREIGLLQSVGYPLAKIRRRFLYEGATLAGIGSLLGCLFAVGYAQLMIFGLQTWWLPAIGTPFMELHVNLLSLSTGILIALAVVMVSIRFIVQELGQIPATALLAGETDFAEITHKGQTQKTKSRTLWSITKNVAAAFIGVLFAVFVIFDKWISETFGIWVEEPMIDFLVFTLSIIGIGWAAFDRWLKSQRVPKRLNRLRLALKSAARQPGRSLVSVQTLSLACCIIVAVGANRHDAPPESEYAFVAESALPLHHTLNTPEGKFELGFSDKDSELLNASEIFPFRVLPGEDVSCLNLYQPQKPQILGAPDAMLDKSPWDRLRLVQPESGRAPAIGDENSLRWILHHNPEDDYIVQDEFGKPLRLELETVSDSLFQSQLILSESNFTKYFPSRSGYQFFLIKTPPELREETAKILEKTLVDYGFDLTSASDRLASYRAVENTYISTFQSLGGLGVLLGTFGLALILFRNIIERRGELATLRAFGFRRQLLSRMLFLESCFLLVVGMVIGIVAGLVAILGSQGHLPSFPWVSLTITLLLIFVFGIIANAVAVAVALRSPLLSMLKSE